MDDRHQRCPDPTRTCVEPFNIACSIHVASPRMTPSLPNLSTGCLSVGLSLYPSRSAAVPQGRDRGAEKRLSPVKGSAREENVTQNRATRPAEKGLLFALPYDPRRQIIDHDDKLSKRSVFRNWTNGGRCLRAQFTQQVSSQECQTDLEVRELWYKEQRHGSNLASVGKPSRCSLLALFSVEAKASNVSA